MNPDEYAEYLITELSDENYFETESMISAAKHDAKFLVNEIIKYQPTKPFDNTDDYFKNVLIAIEKYEK